MADVRFRRHYRRVEPIISSGRSTFRDGLRARHTRYVVERWRSRWPEPDRPCVRRASADGPASPPSHLPLYGLTSAIDPSHSDGVSQWLDNHVPSHRRSTISIPLGRGGPCRLRSPANTYLSSFPIGMDGPVTMPRQPILINWLITGRCPLACRYCYAEDLMRDEALEPNRSISSAS